MVHWVYGRGWVDEPSGHRPTNRQVPHTRLVVKGVSSWKTESVVGVDG